MPSSSRSARPAGAAGCGMRPGLRDAGCGMRPGPCTAGSIPDPVQLLPWQEPVGFLSALSPCCFPSAVLFQHLIIYRGLCGRLYRGSYCLIELLDSSAAKIITRVKKRYPLDKQPGERADLPVVGGDGGGGGQHPPQGQTWACRGGLGSPAHVPRPEDCETQPEGRGMPRGSERSVVGALRGAQGVAERGCCCPAAPPARWAHVVAEPHRGAAGIHPASSPHPGPASPCPAPLSPVGTDAELRASPPAEIGNREFGSIFPFPRGNPAPGSPCPFCY